MRFEFRFIDSISELKTIIKENKDDVEFRMGLIDSLVDNKFNSWLEGLEDDESIVELLTQLKGSDWMGKTDSELLQEIYNIFQIDEIAETPDLSECFEFLGVKVDDNQIVINDLTSLDNRPHIVKAVVRIVKPINEKLVFRMVCNYEKRNPRIMSNNFSEGMMGQNKGTLFQRITPDPNKMMERINAFLNESNNEEQRICKEHYSEFFKLCNSIKSKNLSIEEKQLDDLLLSGLNGNNKNPKFVTMAAMFAMYVTIRSYIDIIGKNCCKKYYNNGVLLNVSEKEVLEIAFPEVSLSEVESIRFEYKNNVIMEYPIRKTNINENDNNAKD